MFKRTFLISVVILICELCFSQTINNRMQKTQSNGEIEVSKTAIDFDTLDIGKQRLDSLTIKNIGSGNLTIDSIFTDTSQFHVESYKGIIAPSDSVIIYITFEPQNYGEQSGNLVISSDDDDEPSILVHLAGFADDKIPVILVSDSVLTFNETEIGEIDTLILTIANEGDTSLIIYNISSNYQEFVPLFSDTIIALSDSIHLPILFKPLMRKEYTAQLTIESNDPVSGNIAIELNGKGVAAEISVSEDSLNFGITSVADTVERKITITNTGELDLIINGFFFQKDSLAAFYTNAKDTLLTSLSSMNLSIYYNYRPQISNEFKDTLYIHSNDPIAGEKLITLYARTYRKFFIPTDFSKIQSGIDSSWSGDSLIVSPGVYKENINFIGKNITLGSHYLFNDDTSYVNNTIIDGDNKDNVVKFINGEDSTSALIGFTIKNGTGNNGGGIYIDKSSPALRSLKIVNNGWGQGGGIYCSESNSIFFDLLIENNKAIGGGGLYLNYSNPKIENVRILNNRADINEGGGISCSHSDPQIINSEISFNFAYEGGGISCHSSSPQLFDVLISNNISDAVGGGLCCATNSNPVLSNVEIIGNSAYDGAGGIECYTNSNPYINNCLISGNIGGNGGGILCWASNNIQINNVVLVDNSAKMNGGGIYLKPNSKAILTNVLFYNNNAENDGGAIVCNDSDIDLINVTISKNSASAGGSLLFYGSSNPVLFNSIVWDNSPSKIDFVNVSDGVISVATSDIQDGMNGILYNNEGQINWLDGNIDLDPQFKNPLSGDYHLEDDSPCIGVGSMTVQIEQFDYSAPSYDIENNDRPNPNSSNPDMGAFENSLGTPTQIKDQIIEIPKEFSLGQNYPNPFNPSTKIKFALPYQGKVKISIYDVLGHLIEVLLNENRGPGYHQISFDGINFSSGLYFYVIKIYDTTDGTEIYSDTKKMILMK